MGDAEYSDGSETETERGWFSESRTNGANLAEPIGAVARAGQLGAPLGIAHLALGAVTAAMSAFSTGRQGKGEGDGLPRVRMLSCLHALFTQLHDPERAEASTTDAEENGRQAGQLPPLQRGPPLDHSELDVLEKAVRILHLRYRSCLRPLTKGRLPSRTELRELRGSAEALGARATVLCLDKIPKGDRRRLPLFAFRTFALRAELDAEALRELREPSSPEWDMSSYTVATTRLRDLLEDMAEEVEALWDCGSRTLYDTGVLLAPVLAQYTLLGKAVKMAVEQFQLRLTVRKHGRVIYAVGDEIILWDDGLEEVRELFAVDRGYPDRPLGSAIRIDSMQDYSWFVSWNGTSPVDSIPSEVSVKKLLMSVGAPLSRAAQLRASDKPLLMNVALPDLRAEAEQRIAQELGWATVQGAKFDIRPGKPPVGQAYSGEMALGGGSPTDAHQSGNLSSGGEGSKKKSQVLQRRAVAPTVVETVLDSAFAEDPEPAKGISYAILLHATNEWADDMKLGEGGSAVVYKGVSPEGQLWAVKRGKKGGLTRLKDFEKEIEAVSHMNHPNLVRLLGYCEDNENDEQVLVYEFVPHGTLREHLNYQPGVTSMLTFERRLDIAVGVAEGLYYLHSSKPSLVHRDVKSLNVFMDANMQPKLGDFGSLKHIGDDLGSQTLTRVVGTPGYLDPQYCQTSIVSDRSDVYSFGVVLLELITGKPPVMKEGEDGSGERMALAKWATPAICAGNTESVVDPSLSAGSVHPGAMQALASLAAMCVQRQPKDRPNMAEVTRRLKSIRAQALSAAIPSASSVSSLRGSSSSSSRGGRLSSPLSLPRSPLHHPQQQQQQQHQRDQYHQHQAYQQAQGGYQQQPPMTPPSPLNDRGGYHGSPLPQSLSGGGGNPDSPQASGSQKGSLFNKDFWKPKRAPTRSLSDASMGEITDYIEGEPDGSLSSPTGGTANHHPGGHREPLPRSNLSPFRNSSSTGGPAYAPTTPQGPGSSYSQPQFIPKTKSADGMANGPHHQRSNSSAGQQQQGQQGQGQQQGQPQAQQQAMSGPLVGQTGNSPGRFVRRGSKMKEALMALAKLQHCNVAPVLGFAADREGEGQALTYELPSNCTPLSEYLIPEGVDEEEEEEALPLRIRLKVAVGVARGLGYLHANGVIHGNLHPTNIMLDRNFSVLLSGYGQPTLQQMKSSSSRRSNSRSVGTMAKDTFDYGLVLYELLTGRRRCDLASVSHVGEAMAEWAEPWIEDFEASMSSAEQPAKRMVMRMLDVLAKECVQEDPHCRPSMKDLMVRLQGLQESLTAQ